MIVSYTIFYTMHYREDKINSFETVAPGSNPEMLFIIFISSVNT